MEGAQSVAATSKRKSARALSIADTSLISGIVLRIPGPFVNTLSPQCQKGRLLRDILISARKPQVFAQPARAVDSRQCLRTLQISCSVPLRICADRAP